MYAVIIAGGRGTRFWPWSREAVPKQFLPITGPKPMLRETVDRLYPDFKADDILVVTGEGNARLVAEIAPEISSQNVILEPEGRNTAPAIGLAAAILARRDENAVLAILPSDHVIEGADEFRAVLKQAEKLVGSDECIVTIGIMPKFPETGYGYIRFDKKVHPFNGVKAHKVRQFREKPDEKQAARFVASGDYLWNAGIFVAKARTLLDAFAQHLPSDHEKLMAILESVGTSEQDNVIRSVFPEMSNISIDYGIMQEYRNTLIIPASFGWSDVGSFRALYDIYEPDKNGNVAMGEVISEDSTGNLLRSHAKPIALVGVKDLVVIDTDDVLLICHKYAAQRITNLVNRLRLDGKFKNLT